MSIVKLVLPMFCDDIEDARIEMELEEELPNLKGKPVEEIELFGNNYGNPGEITTRDEKGELYILDSENGNLIWEKVYKRTSQ